jgi:hypothetical protein
MASLLMNRVHGRKTVVRSASKHARLVEKLRAELLKAAHERRTLTYGYLMKRFSLSRGRVIPGLLGEIDRAEHEPGSPGLAPLVVRKDTHFPGGGFFCDEDLPPSLRRARSRSTDPILTPDEEAYVKSRQVAIWSHYSRSKDEQATT